MWGRGAAADSLPGHVCQQLLSWPREEQGGADLAGNQGKGRPFLDRHSVITVCQTLWVHRSSQATVEVKRLLSLSPH